ncbi:MAG: peptidase S41, partial [Bacteroidota bacterium]
LRIYLPLLFFSLIFNYSFSQEKKCTCIEKLNETSIALKKSISYKSQVKDLNREKELESWKNRIEREIANDR